KLEGVPPAAGAHSGRRRPRLVNQYGHRKEDQNRRELAGGFGGDPSQIGGVGKGDERYAAAETASRLGPLLSRRHRRRPRSLVYRKGRFPSQGGFGRTQNSSSGSAQNHVPWLHGL